MNKLCKKCKWRCKVVLYDGNAIMMNDQCYIRIDAGCEYDPIAFEGDNESCGYYELRDSRKVKKSEFAKALDYIKNKKRNNV